MGKSKQVFLESITKHPKKENLHFKVDFLINFTNKNRAISLVDRTQAAKK
jgi:hypothetical protein